MNVNEEKKYIFIHIPKTGGTTISNQLHLKGGRGIAYKGDDFKNYSTQHYNIPQLLAFNGRLRQDYLWKYFIFTIVRNPWDRFVSEYSQRQASGDDKNFKQLLEYAEECVNLYNKGIFYNKGVHNKISHFIPQYTFVYFCGMQIPSFVGRFEKYDDAILYISSQINYDLDLRKHLNKSDHGHYSKYYNWKTKRKLMKLYKDDIKLFNYKFER